MFMISYLIAFFCGFAMLLSFIGIGYLFNSIVFPNKKFDLGFQAIFGSAIFLTLGGYLNLFRLISKPLLLSILATGLLIMIFVVIRYRKKLLNSLYLFLSILKKDKIFTILIFFVLSIFLLRYALATSFFPFHGTDDYHGYLVFPSKMIETGSLGNDPFSERRIVSSLGGKYFLDAVVLSFASLKNLHLVDNGIGFLLLIVLLAYFLIDLGLEKKKSLFLLLLLLLIPTPSYNITSFFLAAALFLGLFRFLYFKNDLKHWQVNIIVSLIVGSLIILKTNLIIPAITMFVCFFVSTFYHQNKKAWIKNILLSLLIFSLMLLPWMISMYQSFHTLLYPFFGKGYYGTSYGNFAGSFFTLNLYSIIRLISELFTGLRLFLPLIILGSFIFYSRYEKRKILLFVFVSCLLGIAAVIYGVGGYSMYYYTFPFVLPTILFLLAVFLADKNIYNKLSTYSILIVTFMMGIFLQKDLDLLMQAKKNISFDNGVKIGLLNTEMLSASELTQYKNLQLAVPEQETILARLDRNFLFDFRRNNIFIIDLPGGASLPPGLPYKEGAEKLSNYLLGVGIKYVAYSYANEANFPKNGVGGMLKAHVNPWLKTETEHSLDFQDNLMELYKTRKVIYDDGKNFVLDLSMKK